jgi:ribosomal protein S18 acetylase RimI-like enzyme
MRDGDIATVVEIAGAIHPAYHEDEAIFHERLRLSPNGCFVLEQNGRLFGYAISHPWLQSDPPPLNSLLGGLPREPTTYYIHDLAILPEARGRGAGEELLALLIGEARSRKLTTLSLVAVNNSVPFWNRHGFESAAAPLQKKLASYGGDARLLELSV